MTTQILSVRLVSGTIFHTHRPETVARLRSRRLRAVSSVELISRCNPTICETCKTHDQQQRLNSPFTVVADIASIALAVGARLIEVGPSGLLAIRKGTVQ